MTDRYSISYINLIYSVVFKLINHQLLYTKHGSRAKHSPTPMIMTSAYISYIFAINTFLYGVYRTSYIFNEPQFEIHIHTLRSIKSNVCTIW